MQKSYKNTYLMSGIIFIFLFFIITISCSHALSENKLDMDHNDIDRDEYNHVISKADEKIQDLENLLAELEKKQNILNEIRSGEDPVQFGIISDLDKVTRIVKQTPLDLETANIVVAYAQKFDVNPSLILAVIKQESNFKKYEVGSSQDRGYMQIIPETEKWLVSKYGKKLGIKYNPKQIFEPKYNIGLGVVYLSVLKKAHGENYNKILSEYNRGPHNLKRYYNKHKTYVTAYSRGILSKEKNYLQFNK
ncbi:transglycosylase SLT domain-containing protein [Lutibacter sp. B2]|nr:transglycosylase SLT domain-containing protein [Lutibacter sp. B2]